MQISNGDSTMKIPVVIQPGQAKGSIGLALGYAEKQEFKKDANREKRICF